MKKIVLSSIVVGLLSLGFSGCDGGNVKVAKKAEVKTEKIVETKKAKVKKNDDTIVADLSLLKDYKMKSFDDFFMFRYCDVNDAMYKKYRSDIFDLFKVESKNGAVVAFNSLDEIAKLEAIVSMSEIFVNNKFTGSVSGHNPYGLQLINGSLHEAVAAYIKQINLNNKEINVHSYDVGLYITTSVSDVVRILNNIKIVTAKINLFTEKKSAYFEALDDYSKLTKIEKSIVRNTEV